MDWKTIPSLSALRAFEAATRNNSYTAASRELNVTEAAIRQHVRGLEARLKVQLFKRDGRRVSSTAEGRELANALTSSFEHIEEAIAETTRKSKARPIRCAVTPAFAENWLIPRLPSLWQDHPDIQVDLAPSLKPVDLASGEYDLAIRYGLGTWDNCEVRKVVSAEYTIVASPMLEDVRPISAPSDLRDAVWLFEDTRVEHRRWTAENGLDFDAKQNRFYSNNSFVLSAANAGHGYSVQSYALVAAAIEAGGLEAVYREPNEALGYYLLTRETLREDVETLAQWILSVD